MVKKAFACTWAALLICFTAGCGSPAPSSSAPVSAVAGSSSHLASKTESSSGPAFCGTGSFEIRNKVLVQYTGPGGKVVIPKGVTEIADDAFNGCNLLTDVTIPDGVKRIGMEAFSCTNLKQVTIPKSVTEIGMDAFGDTPWLQNSPGPYVAVNDILLCYKGTDHTARIPDGITKIGAGSFGGYSESDPDTVILPESVTEIGDQAFNCTGLTEICMPGVQKIGGACFYGCSNLKTVHLSEHLAEIGDSAFEDCKSLKNISLPKSVKEIGEAAFGGCSSLTEITIPNGVMQIKANTFRDCTSLKSITIPKNVTEIGENTFSGGKNFTIRGGSGSAAETYAKENKIAFQAL